MLHMDCCHCADRYLGRQSESRVTWWPSEEWSVAFEVTEGSECLVTIRRLFVFWWDTRGNGSW
jgi:hypothetical protein